jgi:hypothetical protein
LAAANAPQPASQPDVKFATQAQWDLAGYNNDEVVYTITIANQDVQTIHCVTDLQGFYYQDGEKHSVTDRQSVTILPQQRALAGNWQGMDKNSGATYSVKCRPM